MENFKELNYRGTDFLVGDYGTIYRDGSLAYQAITPDGYRQVYLPGSSIKVHRLVAMCWVPGRTEERNEVNHKDFNRQNNVASNLEWVTHAENIQYSNKYGKPKNIQGANNPNWGNKRLHEKYQVDKELARFCQGRPGSRNGRAAPVDVYQATEDGLVFVGHFDYLGACAEYMHENFDFPENPEAFRLGVRRSIKRNVPYKGFVFRK